MQHWVRGDSINSIFHNGPVGINVECPDDALCVRGNIRLSGSVLQPSDRRLKADIIPLCPAQQLTNVRAMSLYRYRLTDAWAVTCGRQNEVTHTHFILILFVLMFQINFHNNFLFPSKFFAFLTCLRQVSAGFWPKSSPPCSRTPCASQPV